MGIRIAPTGPTKAIVIDGKNGRRGAGVTFQQHVSNPGQFMVSYDM